MVERNRVEIVKAVWIHMIAFQVTWCSCACFPFTNIYAFELTLMLMESKFWNHMCDYLPEMHFKYMRSTCREKALPNVKKIQVLIELYSMSQVQRFCSFQPPSQHIIVAVQTNMQVNTLQRGFYFILTSGTPFVYLQGFLYNRNQGAVQFSVAVR